MSIENTHSSDLMTFYEAVEVAKRGIWVKLNTQNGNAFICKRRWFTWYAIFSNGRSWSIDDLHTFMFPQRKGKNRVRKIVDAIDINTLNHA